MPRPLTRRALAAALTGAAVAARVPRATARAAQDDPGADRIESALARLPLAAKVAQLVVVGAAARGMTPEEATFLEQTRPGGVILLAHNVGTPEEVAAYAAAIKATNPDLPPFVAVDQEGGPVARLPNDPAPGAAALGLLPDAEVRELAAERAAFVAGAGFDVNFAPVADVAFGPDSVMADRAFGADPALVAAKVGAYVEGAADSGVLHAAKHFPGHGRAALDSHLALPEIELSLEAWAETDALPFRAAVEAGVPMVMLGHLRYPRWDDAPATLSRVAVDVLRDDLGFDGVVVTDDLGAGMAALAGVDPTDVVDRAVAAGVDLLLFATPTPGLALDGPIAHLLARVEAGAVTEERIDASLRRLLRLKLGR